MNRRAAVLGAFACAAVPLSRSVARAAVQLAVITTPNESAMEPYFAQETGLFAAAGLSVDVTAVPNGGMVAGAISSGAAQIGNSSVPSLAEAHTKGIPIVAIAPGAAYTSKAPSAILFAPQQSSVAHASDLNGKTIAVNNLGGLPQYGTEQWIDVHGGDSRTIHFVEMPGAVIISSLQSGKIDAGLLAEPFISPGRAAAKPLGAVFDALGATFLISVHFSTIAWAQANGDVVRQFQSCIEQAAVWANKNPDQSAAIIAKYTKLTVPMLKGMNRALFADRLTAGLLQPVIDLTARYGKIERFAADDMIYHERA